MLSVSNLSKTYPGGDKALDDVTFTIPSGQVVGLIGPSGAGKSTLIRCINRLVEPTNGSVTLGGLDYQRCLLAAIFHAVGFINFSDDRPLSLERNRLNEALASSICSTCKSVSYG